MITFLVAYFLVSNKKVDAAGIPFNMMQALAALAMAYSVWPVKAWPIITLEGFFILIGLIAIYKRLRIRKG